MTVPPKTLPKRKIPAGVSSSLVCVFCLFLSCSPATAKRPDIIVILVDDMGSKLVSDWGRPWGLYDLAADRFETKDLSKETTPLSPHDSPSEHLT